MHPRLSIDQLCFPGAATVADFVAQCRSLGAHHVVLTSPLLLANGGLEAARAALVDGPAVEAVSHPFAIHPDLEHDDGAADTLTRLIAIASELGAPSVYLLTGGRGRLSWDEAANRFCDLVAPGAQAARDRGMRLMIENTNGLYADIHIAHTFADTLTLAERADLGVCIELQFCWAEAGLAELFRRAMPRCALVQVSDYVLGDKSVPGRAVPGDGAVPLRDIIGDLLDAGYAGRFDLELLGPRIDAEGSHSAVTRAVAHLDAILAALDTSSS